MQRTDVIKILTLVGSSFLNELLSEGGTGLYLVRRDSVSVIVLFITVSNQLPTVIDICLLEDTSRRRGLHRQRR